MSDLVVDDEPHDDLLDPEHRSVLLHESLWREASLRVTSDVGGAFRRDLTGDTVDLRAHALLRCSETLWRTAIPLEKSWDGAWSGLVPVRSSVLAGSPELTVEVTGLVGGVRRLVARSEPWRLVSDRASAPASSGAPPFDSVWVDFSHSDAPTEARVDPGAYTVLATGPKGLVLYLNSAIEGLRDLLHADHAKGQRRQVRDLVGAEVARTALAAVVRAAVADVLDLTDADEAAQLPSDRTARQALAAVAGAMPSVGGVDELLERIVDVEHGPASGRFSLWAQIDSAVARLAGTTGAIADTAREVRFV
ncbi:hypothetical protein [Cellulomonas marina]|uniref:hypothetical protein n=1 Tax=Cellulomonas marina TaxID=988821 RepID=UPI000B7DB7EE|nr:hypothetical protein [Cellulomonas marina]